MIDVTLVQGVQAAVPVASFTGTPTSGSVPLPVQFTDASTGSPTGYAWFFGDETYTQAWTQQTTSAGWSGRYEHTSVAMPDGSIVLMGGIESSASRFMNDTWRSIDKGSTWTRMNASSGWSARDYHSSVAMPDSSIVLMGGEDSKGKKNDVWRSTDYGATWTQMTASAGWSARYAHSSVAIPDGSIVLMGGDSAIGAKNDVWRSTDNGATWTQMTSSAGWSAREYHSSVAIPDGSIVLMGGNAYEGTKNDVWRSTDNGVTWTQQTTSAGWSARITGHCSVAMPDGSIVLMGGIDNNLVNKNDVWRSTNNGITWTEVTASAGWTGRQSPSCVAMPDGSIVLMGGYGAPLPYNKNDVWRLMPVGSSVQNPSHAYTAPGIYHVALQAYNIVGYNSIRKTEYITVGDVTPVANFIGMPTSGTVPLTVKFTDLSTYNPI